MRSDSVSKIAIVSDSTSDLTLETREKYNIRILPLRVIYTDGEYKDRVDITPEEIYARFKEEIPTTSLPSPQDTMDLLNQLKQEDYTHVIIVTISSGISGTMNMIRNIADSFEGLSFEIIDSKSLTMGAGFAIIEGSKELERTNDFEKTVNRIKEVLSKTKVYYVVKTLEYLKKGGRIGKVEGTIGELLNIKPIIAINEDGVYYSYKKVRGAKPADSGVASKARARILAKPSRYRSKKWPPASIAKSEPLAKSATRSPCKNADQDCSANGPSASTHTSSPSCRKPSTGPPTSIAPWSSIEPIGSPSPADIE
jgi:DegV family protein with EDD domain